MFATLQPFLPDLLRFAWYSSGLLMLGFGIFLLFAKLR